MSKRDELIDYLCGMGLSASSADGWADDILAITEKPEDRRQAAEDLTRYDEDYPHDEPRPVVSDRQYRDAVDHCTFLHPSECPKHGETIRAYHAERQP